METHLPAWASISRDYNNDGLPDLVVTDLATQKYMLFQNSGDGTFTAQTESSGLARASMTFNGMGNQMGRFR